MARKVPLERRVVVIPESGHGLCAERVAERIMYRGAYRLTLCAHSESDIRASVVPTSASDTLFDWILEEVERFQRRLGAER